MNKYQNGKIYAIRSYQTEEFYIGSTCDKLSKRFYNHKAKFKQFQNGKGNCVTSFKMLEYPDARMELLENCPCNDKNELTRREGELIRANPNCVNKNIAGRTDKEWRQANAETIKANRKEYRQANAEHIKETMKQYRQANAEHIKAHKKQYQQANTHKLKEKHDCPCGGKYTTENKSHHSKSKRHQAYLETLP